VRRDSASGARIDHTRSNLVNFKIDCSSSRHQAIIRRMPRRTESAGQYAEAFERIHICELTLSRDLDLSNLQLSIVPAQIARLPHVFRLTLSGNELSTLPPEIGFLHNLSFLDLSNNRLQRLPREMRGLTRLEVLLLQNNQLTDLPPEIARLRQLDTLDLDDNRFASIPMEVCQLPELTALSMCRNQLTELPATIGQLGSLETLHLSQNRLGVVPPEVGRLTNLMELHLDANALEGLPRELFNLRALEVLSLHGNRLLELPEDILGLQSPETTGNETTSASPKAILDYYFARQEQGEAPIQEVRLLLVGRGRVGKTSLLKCLRGEAPNDREPETPGITVRALPLNCPRGPVRGHLWDFGGQEFLHGTHQIFLSERCVYLLVLEGAQSTWEMETDYWLRFIQTFAGSSPVIVVLNKYDLHAFSVDRFRLRERCPQIADFVETDAFTGRGIGTLVHLLENTVNEMSHVWLGVPKRWHRVKEHIARMPRSFLEYRDYQTLCARLEVTEAAHQDSLAENLHRLGIALNFRDHHRLRHTSVLKPTWVTEAVYGLLRYAQQRDCQGILEREWVAHALPASDYPVEKHDFVLDLMEKFEVAFKLETQDAHASERWLIPELLPEVQPHAFDEFRGPGASRVRFSYPEALPPGLLPRLIVRTRELSQALPGCRWRSGVVIQWMECRALVRLDRHQRRTEATVIGRDAEARHDLFDIIRSHLNTLHDKVPAIEEVQVSVDPEKWVPMADLRIAEREHEESVRITIASDRRVERTRISVERTLDSVESPAARRATRADAEERMQLFVSYAHQNEKELLPLRQHLTLLSQQGYIQSWNDRDLVAGERWETGIIQMLSRADVILIFYTTAARVSTFIQQHELPTALLRADQGLSSLIWVPLERNDLNPTHPLERRLAKLQCATQDKKNIYAFEPVQVGWLQVEDSIRRVVERRRKPKPEPQLEE
jgi:internalin A